MPSYFYHLTFELYPTSNPTDRDPPSTEAPELWVPPHETDIFGDLPSHQHRSKTKPKIKTAPRLYSAAHIQPQSSGQASSSSHTEPGPSVIDCGANRKPHEEDRRKIEIVPERKWRERTKSLPPPPSSAAIQPQTAVRDWRFGRVSIESIDFQQEEEREVTDATMGDAGPSSAAAENPNAAAFAALELGPTLGGDGSSTRAECVSVPTKNTEVGWGVVHFYRGEEMPPVGLTAGGASTVGPEEDGCTTLCIPAVPSYILPAEFLGFVGEKWRSGVTHFRMVMTSRMSRYLVLLKFRDNKKAKEWQKEFNGKVFNSMVAEICHVVFVKSITFETPTRPREAEPSQSRASYTLKPFPPPTPNLIELPTCPVCLERMDDTNGLMTIPCQHVFHCTCLQNWSGSGCPVCRYSNPSHNDASGSHAPAFGSSISNLCAVCDSTSDLWICLICGRVGCGRYKGGHAKEHWKETAHSFALEIETQHVWDYAGDTWVHRLIRAKGDGKVVELPSHNREGHSEDEDVVPRAKVEAMGLEYTHLLTSQLESQRVYFEEKIAQAADKAHKATLLAESAAAESLAALERIRIAEAKCTELQKDVIPSLEKDLKREKAKAAKTHDLARSLGKELQEERQMSKGLADRVEYMKKQELAIQDQLKELEELRETNRDLSMFISGQARLKELETSGQVESGELEEGTAMVGSKARKGKGKK